MKNYILSIFIIFGYSLDNNPYLNNMTSNMISNNHNSSQNQLSIGNNIKSRNLNQQILFQYVDSNTYIVGPGDIFSFNMIIPSTVINLELEVSPTGEILIPTIGTVNVSKKNLTNTYKTIIDKCKNKYEDAFIYVMISRLRMFKVLIAGITNSSGMHPVYSIDRVSDLIEYNYNFSQLDTTLSLHMNNFNQNILLDKDIFLIRDGSRLEVDLFNYYMNGDFNSNPQLIEGDIVDFRNSNKVTVIGAVDKPTRIREIEEVTYREIIEKAMKDKNSSQLSSIKVINYKMLTNYSESEIERISDIQSRYRSDFDESFLSSRVRTKEGFIYINDEQLLKEFLDLKVSSGDIIIIPNKIDYVEIIGGVKKPGSYKYNPLFNITNYLDNSGGFSKKAKKKDIYLIDNVSGMRLKIDKGYQPNPGDVIFIQETVGFKSWDRFTESIRLAGTIATMSLVMFNIWDKLTEE